MHATEKGAYEQWLEWQFSGDLDEEEKADEKAAATFIGREDFDGLWAWKGDREFGEPFDTYSIEVHEIEIPEDCCSITTTS
ncbi:MAG: hypothetical protein ACRD3N_17095 [Terracidiphilus sp.]